MILSHLPLGRKIVEEHITSPPSDLMEMLAEYPGSHEWKESLFNEAIQKMSSSIEEHDDDGEQRHQRKQRQHGHHSAEKNAHQRPRLP